MTASTPPATRSEALRRLCAFAPRSGRRYQERRNIDEGPGRREAVSGLSPLIRHRLVLEEEVVAAALAEHGLPAAEKFVQEVCWRTYWKGWLEMRPGVWRAYRTDLERRACGMSSGERRQWERATSGETGLECFDAWSHELTGTGYLHNHARMWFASLWIFTLRLPWQLGADFFLRHLLDGDPASNTLAWRWVAGLQTPGKTYLARADNIARYTCGRFRPDPASLASEAPALEEPERFPVQPLPAAAESLPDAPLGLLVTEEDLVPELLFADRSRIVAAAGATHPLGRSPFPVADAVVHFTESALTDALGRVQAAFGLRASRLEELESELADWAEERGVRDIVTPDLPVGPMRDRLDALVPHLERRGVRLHRIRRAWDTAFWPHARRGFFGLKKVIPRVLSQLGLS